MPFVASQRHRGQFLVADLDAQRVAATIQLGVNGQASAGRGRPISSTTTWWLTSGRPRQLTEIALNSRCSILFHCNDLAVVVVARV
jgi:hypothetical protein